MRHRWGVYMSRLPEHGQLNSLKASQELKPVRVSGIRLFTTINGLVGDVSASIRFYNHLPVTGPSVFLFPLTHSASVKQCQALIFNRTNEIKRSVTLEAHQVAEHEKTSKAGFVIEQSASNVVELQLGLLAPGDQVEITLQYAMLFDVEESGLIKFVFPTFLPRELQSYYTELCSPEIYETLNLQCRAVISGEYRIRKVVSDHKLEVNYKNEQRKYVQIDTAGSYVLSKDFCFCIAYADLDQPRVHIHSPVRRKEKTTHWLLSSYCAHLTMHHAAKKAPSAHQTNEYILCIDRSGSMYGSKIELIRDVITHFIGSLQPGSFFNIISFGSTIRPLFKTSQKLTVYSARKALKLRNSIKANMFATNIYSLLQYVYSCTNKTGNCKQIYLITDGGVEDPDSCVELVRQNSDCSRMFTFGIDRTASRYLVSNLARAGNGKSYYLKNSQILCSKVIEAMRLSAQPSLTNLNISIELPSGMQLSTQPDLLPSSLFSSETLSVCLIFSGQPVDSQTKCSMKMTGKLEGENFEHVREFDLKDAVVTHGSALHQLAVKTHLHNLETDVSNCRNADEILEIYKEMIDLSVATGSLCKQTKHVCVDTVTRRPLNHLPLIICKPELNFSPHSSTGIDIFKSNQVALRTLMTRHSALSSTSLKKSSTQRAGLKEYQSLRIHPYHGDNSSTPKRTREIKGQMYSTTDGPAKIEAARKADGDTDSYQSSLVNTDMDSMSLLQYESDSLPAEVFNIIEEYRDKGFGSQESSFGTIKRRPTDFPRQVSSVGISSKPVTRRGEITPLNMASTSDYYSLEVSPVSDVLSYKSRQYSREDVTKHRKNSYSRHNSVSSSGVASTCEDSFEDASMQSFSFMNAEVDSLLPGNRAWSQEDTTTKKRKASLPLHVPKQCEVTEGRLALHNPRLLDLLISENPLSVSEHKKFLKSTPNPTQTDPLVGDVDHLLTAAPVRQGQRLVCRTPSASGRETADLQEEKFWNVPREPSTQFSSISETAGVMADQVDCSKAVTPVPHPAHPAVHSKAMVDTTNIVFHTKAFTDVSRLAIPLKAVAIPTDIPTGIKNSDKENVKFSPSQVHAVPLSKKGVQTCRGFSPNTYHYNPSPVVSPNKHLVGLGEDLSGDSGGVVCWKGREVKHLGSPRYGGKLVIKPDSQRVNQHIPSKFDLLGPTEACAPLSTEHLTDDQSARSDCANAFPMMDDHTSTSDLSSLVREFRDKDVKPANISSNSKDPSESNVKSKHEQPEKPKTHKLRTSWRSSLKRLRKIFSRK